MPNLLALAFIISEISAFKRTGKQTANENEISWQHFGCLCQKNTNILLSIRTTAA